MIDTLLTGGLVVDGSGGDPYAGAVGLRGETIAHVGRGARHRPPARRSVDCTGLVICPGFVDVHTHSDLSFLVDRPAGSKVVQGVTTDVTGNCGFSPFPVHRRRREALAGLMSGLGTPPIEIAWDDLDGYARAVEAAGAVTNLAPLTGHGALRIASAGTADVSIGPAVLDEMRNLLCAEMRRGAFGLSTGLTYVPSMFATAGEIHALAAAVRELDGLYATHARADADPYAPIEEAIEVGRRTGVRVQYSHVALNDPRHWGRARDVIGRFAAARDAGVDVRYDVYPYDASASSLTQYLPAWLQERGEPGLRQMREDPARYARARRELARGLYGSIPWDWTRVVLSLTGPGDERLEGCTVADAASRSGVTPEDLVLELCARQGNLPQVVLFYRDERDVARFVAHPLGVLGSDGRAMSEFTPGRPHPRSFGAHVRLLQRYVRERPALSLAQAVHMSTTAPAQRLSLRRRGRLAEGWAADVTVLDLAAVRETSTWNRPKSLARGVHHVWVNGERVLRDGRLTGATPGRILRHGTD